MAVKVGNRPVRLSGSKQKLAVVCRDGGGRINLRYRRWTDARGKVHHELIGPFDLTNTKTAS